MTSKGSISGQLDRAIAAGQTIVVRGLAAELRHPPSLERAAAMTLMFLEHEPESYAAAVRRLVARLASERDIAIAELARAAEVLNHLEREPLDQEARDELAQLVKEAPRSSG